MDTIIGGIYQTLKGHLDLIRSSVAFLPNNQLLASGSNDTTVRLWNTGTGELRQTLKGHSDFVRSVAFSPDGQLLASSSDDKTVRLWNTNTGELYKTLEGHSDLVWSEGNAELSILDKQWVFFRDHSFDYYFTLVLLSTHLNLSNEAFLPLIRNTELRHPRYLLYDLSTPQNLERNLCCLRSLGPGFSTTVNLDAFAHSRTAEAAARWVVDSITLNTYATATSNIQNAQPLNVQCERL
ncbi:uncharacterized protein N7518_004758 [Penicillium psychrosexuale]|uniref:uncharacterized protein n=1 Tax=Penicillium psychrosexuale TaxID=1002107 RepID=UPI0025455896|nr:uncharacterized protein N7518_004758 [Penicillium psychrosexuale]KAJ5796218.1 hypothetical protein N7518_004758 [Penicillium psychrosexuale]